MRDRNKENGDIHFPSVQNAAYIHVCQTFTADIAGSFLSILPPIALHAIRRNLIA